MPLMDSQTGCGSEQQCCLCPTMPDIREACYKGSLSLRGLCHISLHCLLVLEKSHSSSMGPVDCDWSCLIFLWETRDIISLTPFSPPMAMKIFTFLSKLQEATCWILYFPSFYQGNLYLILNSKPILGVTTFFLGVSYFMHEEYMLINFFAFLLLIYLLLQGS